MRLLYILLVPFLLAACADASAVAPQSGNAAYALEIAKGRATASAIETDAAWSANAALTADARTVVASNRNATLAAQAQQNAMLYAQATSTAQAQYSSATSTALYNIARAAETMQAGQAQASATAAARASDATATSEAHKWQTTATAERRTLEAEIARVEATGTAQAVALQIEQTKADAAANAERAQFVQSIANLFIAIVGVFVVGFTCAALVALALFIIRALQARAARQWLVTTPAGNILVSRDDNGRFFAEPVQPAPRLFPQNDTPVLPPVVPMRDMVDRQAIERETAPPDPQMLNGFIHYTSLRAFVAAILDSNDWTQKTWADRELPRGFVLTKDSADERGNIIHGGYTRVIALLVENNIIINRRRGTAGQWNPNAPRDADAIMQILYHEQPRPALPDAPPAPTAARASVGAA